MAIEEYIADYTKPPRGHLRPSLNGPLATLILAVAQIDCGP